MTTRHGGGDQPRPKQSLYDRLGCAYAIAAVIDAGFKNLVTETYVPQRLRQRSMWLDLLMLPRGQFQWWLLTAAAVLAYFLASAVGKLFHLKGDFSHGVGVWLFFALLLAAWVIKSRCGRKH